MMVPVEEGVHPQRLVDVEAKSQEERIGSADHRTLHLVTSDHCREELLCGALERRRDVELKELACVIEKEVARALPRRPDFPHTVAKNRRVRSNAER